MSEELKLPEQSAEEFVRMLLWDEFPECCGSPVVGAEYMGQQEMICCGNPEPALLTDAQIVAALRERFPEGAAAASRDAEVQRLREDAERYRWLRDRFHGVDFDYGGDDENSGRQVLLFAFDGVSVWGDLDMTVDAARAALKEQQ